MAGLYSLFHSGKPGKSVDPDAPPPNAADRFFILYFRKFTRILPLNFLFFLGFLPVYALIFFQADLWAFLHVPGIDEIGQLTGGTLLPRLALEAAGRFPLPLSLLAVLCSLMFYGPGMCGLTYVLRNFVREEHAWFSDFFVKMKENFWPGLWLGFLDLSVWALMVFNLTLPIPEDVPAVAQVLPWIKLLSALLLVFWLMVRQYIYVLAVTFRLNLRGILKNAAIFALVGFFRNLLVLIPQILLLAPILLIGVYDIVALPLFFFGFTGFLTLSSAYPLVYRHLIAPQEAKDDDDPDDFQDPVDRIDPKLLGG